MSAPLLFHSNSKSPPIHPQAHPQPCPHFASFTSMWAGPTFILATRLIPPLAVTAIGVPAAVRAHFWTPVAFPEQLLPHEESLISLVVVVLTHWWNADRPYQATMETDHVGIISTFGIIVEAACGCPVACRTLSGIDKY